MDELSAAPRWMRQFAQVVWIQRHLHNAFVNRWLEQNPPPPTWTGTPMEWAYAEMPIWTNGGGRATPVWVTRRRETAPC